MNINIGETIKKLRNDAKMTQSDVAKYLHITISSVSAYENGSRTPSYYTLIRIAKLFKVSTDYLLGFSNECVVDISGLDSKQRETVFEIIELYRLKNDDNDCYIDVKTKSAVDNFEEF